MKLEKRKTNMSHFKLINYVWATLTDLIVNLMHEDRKLLCMFLKNQKTVFFYIAVFNFLSIHPLPTIYTCAHCRAHNQLNAMCMNCELNVGRNGSTVRKWLSFTQKYPTHKVSAVLHHCTTQHRKLILAIWDAFFSPL